MRPEPLPARLTIVSDGPFGPPDKDPITPEAVLRFLRLRWRLVGIWAAAGLCAALLFFALAPSYYTAYTTFLLDSSSARAQGDAQGATLTPDPAAFVFSQIELMQSDEVLERVIKAGKLTEDPEFGTSIGNIVSRAAEWLRTNVFHQAEKQALRQQETMIQLRRALYVRRVGISEAVEIGFTSRDPDRSARIANLIARSYVESKIDHWRHGQEAALAELRDRLAELRGKALSMTLPRHLSTDTSDAGDQAREQFRQLQDTTEAYRNLYNAFLQKEYMGASAQSGASPGRTITPAKPPFYTSWPRGRLVLAIGLFLGAAIGLCHGVIRHATEQVVVSTREIETFVHADRIRNIPRQNWLAWKLSHSENSWIQRSYARRSARLSDILTNFAVHLQQCLDRSGGKIIGVVSTEAKAGTSTIAAHLANVLAEAKHATLLVDANWRKLLPAADLTPVIENPAGPLYAEPAYLWFASTCTSLLVLRAPKFTSDLAILQQIRDLLIAKRREGHRYIIVDFTSIADAADVDACLDQLDHLILVTELGRSSLDAVGRILRSLRPDLAVDVFLNKS